ncbi:amphi-Trp domain-containing protein [Desulfonema ishimotonii]|uniref:Amphi-Trp domain-containing protein n=1 Tax=Desulfonema ishimotonii TaxID=45657 RepID=A0A401FXP8_9BACT|nr:amphi-Trp domain-containing protein [Desulfonema ishimotonii]GBC61758.1 amphi-Trp domain-containing protein [Desulfonema ishimotonii]
MKKEIKIKKNMNAEAVAGVLGDLVASFKNGKVCIRSGNDFVTLSPGREFDVEIEAGHKKNRQKLSIELSWREYAPEAGGEADFMISSEEPEIEAPAPAEDASGEAEVTETTE